ncbi:MAG: hypothetical protein JWN76_2234, partial [Chitinophagaceae bacterium]|nr:hypothetical protein [Chitinophagaceae bacterium]
NLTLKVITHYGEFKEYKIRNFRKLIGKDIIIAHQLLKNNISNHEYWLITNSVVENTPNIIRPGMQWNKGIKQVNQTEISFHFVQLGTLKKK